MSGVKFVKIVERILRAGEGRTVKRLDALATQVEALADRVSIIRAGRTVTITALVITGVLSLGLGLALLVTLALIDGNLRNLHGL